MKVIACAKPKTFAKKVFSNRKAELKTVKDSLKKIAKEEISRCKTLFDEHIAFFKEPEPEPVPVYVESFIEKDQ